MVKNKISPGRILGRMLLWLLVTILILGAGVFGAAYILIDGPSVTARALFVRSLRETSAAYWIPDLFCTEEEIAQIEHAAQPKTEPTDTSLVVVPPVIQKNTTDAWGLQDPDGDGIILESVKGPGYVGYMMIVLDPSRMMMGTPRNFGGVGLTAEEMCRTYDCVAAINGGGFHDPEGTGSGGIPEGMIILDGKTMYASEGVEYNFVGFDADHILHTGKMKPAEARQRNIQFGCTFGPVLICNGVRSEDSVLTSGINPRTAIGQRSDGAVLLLVIDGRQAHSLGATYADLADVMERYGAVNACNLDGGSSTAMWLDGSYVNRCAWIRGARPTATAFLVKEAVS